MSKKSTKDSEHEDEKDLEHDEAEGDDEEEERPAVAAKADRSRRERVRAHVADDDHDDSHGHGHADHEDGAGDEEDAYWWAPHAVLSTLVLVGVLGFFGVFNKLLAPIAAKPAGDHDTAHAAATSTAAANPHANAKAPAAHGAAPDAAQTYGARHLLVAYKGAMRAAPTITRTEDEAKARATEAMNKAKDPKNKFEDLVKEYSDEPNAGARGGDLGTFKKGQMVPEFQNAVEKLKVEQISELVKTPFGFHVIKRTK